MSSSEALRSQEVLRGLPPSGLEEEEEEEAHHGQEAGSGHRRHLQPRGGGAWRGRGRGEEREEEIYA